MNGKKGLHELFNETIDYLKDELELMQEVENEYHDRRQKEEKKKTSSEKEEMVKQANLEMHRKLEKDFCIKLVRIEAKIEIVKELMDKLKVE